jgi:uncharacterized membrane protein
MNKGVSLISGLGLGAAMMYLLDPERGNRRRALLRDKANRMWHLSGESTARAAEDLRNRTRGLAAEIRGRFTDEEVSDRVIAERVRAKLGRVVSHPRSIEVTASGGKVTLSGLVLAREEERLLNAVAAVRGVREVESQLEVRQSAGDEPGLQDGTRRESQIDILQRHWSPATRCLAASAGSALAAYGMVRRGVSGMALCTAGAALLARAGTNMEMKRLLGMDGRRGIDLQKTIEIGAPVEEVFRFWARWDNFPRWMSHVRSVRTAGDTRSHWVVDGPAGVPVEFDTIVTEFVPNEVIAWKSEPEAAIRNAGRVRFQPTPNGGTRVEIRFTYNPPAGALGHTAAEFLGADPKRMMDDDLARMKTMIETGVLPHDAAAHAEGRADAPSSGPLQAEV